MKETIEKVRPVSLNRAIYKDMDDKWYWTLTPENPELSGEPIGPFRTREDARVDFRNAMGMRKWPRCE